MLKIVLLKVRQAFDYAFGQLTRALGRGGGSGSGPTLLSRIIQVDQATLDYRDWIKNTFPLLPKERGTAGTED